MAHLHFRRTVYKSGGKAAAARVRYITRDSEHAPQSVAERQIRYRSREGREDLVYTRTRNLPAWAHGSAQTYFRAAETFERANGNAFEEWKITLPQELSRGQNMDLMRDLVRVIAGERLPITYAFHCPPTLDGTHAQPHLHLLLSGRQNDGIARPAAQHFKRYNRHAPARGGAQKDEALRHKRAVKAWRVTISDVINVHLERAGVDECLHPDRLEDREIARQPEPKLFPSQSQQYRDNGTVSETMQEVVRVRAERRLTQGHERENAREYWEARKVALGVTETMDLPTRLARVSEARALVRDHAPIHMLAEGYAGVEQDDRMLGDLGKEAVAQVQANAQTLWVGVQDLADAWALRPSGQERVAQVRTAAQDVGHAAQDEQRLRDVGREAADDAWRDAVLLWAEEQGARALHDVGWEAVQDAREEGHEALAAAWQERWQRLAQAQAWPNLEQDMEALARQLDALHEEEGGTGGVRVRLWDRAQGLGL
jgi:MobA/MobL family